MTKKYPAHKMVTLRELRTAFNKVWPDEWKIGEDRVPAFKKKLEAIFPSKDPSAAVTVKKFRERAEAAALGRKTPKHEVISTKPGPELFRYQLLLDFMRQMPAVHRAIEEERQKADARRERESKKRQSKPETLTQRVERLERENAALIAEIQDRPMTAEEELTMRKYYEENDTRIGGDRNPGPKPGLRD